MDFFSNTFWTSKDEIWQQIANYIGGHFVDGGFFAPDALIYQHDSWEIILDTFTKGGNKNRTTYTRMRAPFLNKDNFFFQLYDATAFSSLGSLLGMQDIEIGDPYFDEHYIIKGNSVQKVDELFHYKEVKNLITKQPRIRVAIQHDTYNFLTMGLPPDVNQLYFEARGVMKDKDDLFHLFQLFSYLLDALVHMDSAYKDDPNYRYYA